MSDELKKLAFPVVGVFGPESNGQTCHPGLVTATDDATVNLLDPTVGELKGLMGTCNVTIFPDLQAPHPAARIPLFNSYESAAEAVRAYAEQGMDFACAYHTHEETDVQRIINEMRAELATQGAKLAEIAAANMAQKTESGPV